MRRTVDLSAHINQTVERGSPADFPVTLAPVLYDAGGTLSTADKRLAVVRQDTGQLLSIVSDRYRLVTHQEILSAVHAATANLDVGPVPRGVYVDRGGARMRAIFKFPALAETVSGTDSICPCVKIANTYDATSRVSIQIGAFRFVCTNLAVGGGGIFAGGFMAIHAGEIELGRVAAQLEDFLTRFETIVAGYRFWTNSIFDWERLGAVLDTLPVRTRFRIANAVRMSRVFTVYSAYNAATNYATHYMRSATAAFEAIELINRGFQRHFPISNRNLRLMSPEPVPFSNVVNRIVGLLPAGPTPADHADEDQAHALAS
jgi:hypothetical protein